MLQADVDLADLESRRAELERDRRVAMARINTLLHRGGRLSVAAAAGAGGRGRRRCPGSRPAAVGRAMPAGIAAQLARIRMEEANLELAGREYYPDVELVAKYDAFMPVDIRPQVGMNLNVPLQGERRAAAIRQAAARVAQRRAEYQDRLDQVRYEVQAACDRLVQQRQVIALFAERILRPRNTACDRRRPTIRPARWTSCG